MTFFYLLENEFSNFFVFSLLALFHVQTVALKYLFSLRHQQRRIVKEKLTKFYVIRALVVLSVICVLSSVNTKPQLESPLSMSADPSPILEAYRLKYEDAKSDLLEEIR